MKIAYFGSDLFMPCLDIFQANGHRIVAIFAALDAENTQQIGNYARANHIQHFTARPNKQQILKLEDEGVQCFFSIEYDCLIPLPSSRVKTINVHPTLLPEGRGPTPLSHIILQYPQYAGVTFHKLAQHFDEGDIILQSAIKIGPEEGLESLLVKLHYKIPQLLHALLSDLPRLYQQAKPQTGGSYWPRLGDQDRLLNWHAPGKNIQRLLRACGRYGVVSCIGQEIWLVNHVETFTTQHSSTPGNIISEDNKTCVVAILDGIAVIYKDSILQRRPINADT